MAARSRPAHARPTTSILQRVMDHPLRPRTVAFDLFGDYVRYSGGRISLPALSELLGYFGSSPDVVRVVVSRLRRDGWIEVERVGQRRVIEMTDKTWRVLDEGRPRIFQRRQGAWDRRWSTVIYTVPESERAARERVRRALSWLGFGGLATSTWICPHDRVQAAQAALVDEPTGRLDLLYASSLGLTHDRAMAARCWPLDMLNRDYAAFLEAHEPLTRIDLGQLSDREALVLRIALVSAYRHFPFRDPDLPAELLPSGWKGHRAHELFLTLHAALHDAAVRGYESVLHLHPVIQMNGGRADSRHGSTNRTRNGPPPQRS